MKQQTASSGILCGSSFSSVLGTPTEENWPSVSQLPDYKKSFPHWSAQDLTLHVPALDEKGIDLLKVIMSTSSQTLQLISAILATVDLRHSQAYLWCVSMLIAVPNFLTHRLICHMHLAKQALKHPYFADYMP